MNRSTRCAPEPDVCTPEEFLQRIEESIGEAIPRPADLAEGECLVCRALGIDAGTPGITTLPGTAIVTLPAANARDRPRRC